MVRDRNHNGLPHIQGDGLGQATRLGEAILKTMSRRASGAVAGPRTAAQVGYDHEGTRRRADLVEAIAIGACLFMLV